MSDIPEHRFEFDAGELALDFANTISGVREPEKEHLRAYGDLLSWGRQAGVLAAADAGRLEREATRRPGEAAATLRRATALREAIYRVFAAGSKTDGDDDLAVISDAAARADAHKRLARHGKEIAWHWSDEPALDRVLWPVARSAAELLTSERRERVRECASETCAWLFVDRSKNRSRRWCDMSDCGNRAKARRFYMRARRATRARRPARS